MGQLIVLSSLGLLAFAALLLVARLANVVRRPGQPHRLLTPVMFNIGALLLGLASWQLLKPAGWDLSFWTTLQASVDSQTYGHPVEHAAEVLAAKVVTLAAVGGLITAGLAMLTQHRASPGPTASAQQLR